MKIFLKDFSMEELLLRVQAILRRTIIPDSAPALRKFSIGKVNFDYDAQILKVDDNEIRLTSKETELLRMLCEYKNQTLERSKALNEIWGDDNYFNARRSIFHIVCSSNIWWCYALVSWRSSLWFRN